jgi:hypothetical protein
MEFLLPFLIRVASGLQNGLGYANNGKWRSICSLLLMAFTALAGLGFIKATAGSYGQEVAAYLPLLLTVVALGGVEDSFSSKFSILPRDIHLYETIFGYTLPLFFMVAGGNVLWIVASTYPALILHKTAINIGSGKHWSYEGTDDPTGKTYTIPLLGITVPRLNLRWRIGLAVVSILFFVVSWLLGWELRLWPWVLHL